MNFKKIVVALAAAFVAVSALAIVASVKLNGNADKSTYRGIGEGRNGPIEVEIKVVDNQIKSARIVKEAESDFAKAPDAKREANKTTIVDFTHLFIKTPTAKFFTVFMNIGF